MIGLLPLPRLIGMIATTYAFIVAVAVLLVWQYGADDQSLLHSALLAFSGGTALQLAISAWVYFGWRKIWERFPALGRALFPDLSGDWAMDINWHASTEQGTVKARAVIEQDFASIGMQVFSAGSDSFTLMAQASRERGSKTPVLYYVYEVQPRSSDRTAGPPYQGAAILRYYEAEARALRGNYWTSAGTRGEFVLRRR